jgi:hypothetical protein
MTAHPMHAAKICSVNAHPLHAIGLWRYEEAMIGLPHPQEPADEAWSIDEREAMAEYLARGVSLRGYFGYSHCRVPDRPPEVEMGKDDLTVGIWVWPEAFHTYVCAAILC